MGEYSFNRRKMLTYLGLSAVSLGGTIACTPRAAESDNVANAAMPEQRVAARSGPTIPEFQGIDHWINSGPLSVNDLKGSVALIQIWTLGCINCQRTLPYIVQWHQKYAAQGLKIVGIHTPEFAYERDLGNVKKAVKSYGIEYAVGTDNRFQTWKAYNNQYWPNLFLADRQGVIRYDHAGEGAYDLTEQTIQQLLG